MGKEPSHQRSLFLQQRVSALLGSLRTRLILLVLLALLPIFGLIFYSSAYQVEDRKSQVKENLLRLARLVAANQEQTYEGARQLLITLSLTPQVRNGSNEECSVFLSSLLPQYPGYALLAVADLKGNIVCSSQEIKQTVNVADRQYFRSALSTSRFSVGDYQIGRLTNRPSLGLAYPVYTASGKIKAVVFATLDLDSYMGLAERFNLQLQPKTNLLVTDRQGTVLLHYPGLSYWQGRSLAPYPVYAQIIPGQQEGMIETDCLETNQSCLFSYRQIEPSPNAGYILMQVETGEAFRPIFENAKMQLFGLLIVSALAVVATWVGGDFFLLRKIRGLRQAANQIAHGNLSARTGLRHGRSELGLLAASFDRMAENLEITEAARSSSEMQLANILQNAPEAIVSIDQSYRVIVFNKGAEEIFGWKSSDILGAPLAALLPNPPDDEVKHFLSLLEHLEDGVSGGPAIHCELTWQGCGASGSKDNRFPGQVSASWMTVNGKKISTLFLADITSRRKTTEELKESRRALSTLLSNLPGMAYRARRKAGRWLVEFASEGAMELTGFAPEELTANQQDTYFRLIHREDAGRVNQEIQNAAVTGFPYRVVYRIQSVSGKEKWVWEQGRLVSPPGSEEPVLEGFITDITERREAERKVENQFRRLTTLRVVDMAITGLLDLQSILSTLVDQIHAQMQVDAAMVLLYTPALTLEYAAGTGFRSRGASRFQCRIGEGLIGQVAVQRKQMHWSEESLKGSSLSLPDLLRGEDFVDCIASPLIAKSELQGVLVIFHRAPLSMVHDWRDFLAALSDQAAIAIDSATLYEQSKRSTLELMMAYEDTIEGWAKALELRDQETEGHSRRVVDLTLELAREMGVPESEMVHIRRGAILHDIGKMGVPDSILQKPGPLNSEEWEKMRQHPVYAYQLLSPIPFLRPALDIPYSHHERWNGSGYPRGLKGMEIPVAARIFAVIDVWDALGNARPYRKALPAEEVRSYLLSQAGAEFDPEIVARFLTMLDQRQARSAGIGVESGIMLPIRSQQAARSFPD